MIRQAISCDICGAEKKQTNHWFVAWEQADELRVSGWNSRNRLRTGSKHLCGQACLHKLADDFMARIIAQKVARKVAPAEELEEEGDAAPLPAAGARAVASRDETANMKPPLRPGAAAKGSAAPSPHPALSANVDASLTSPAAAAEEFESSARLLPSAPLAAPRPAAGLVTIRERLHVDSLPLPLEEPPRFATRNWRAEAWQRERERTQRAGEHRPEIVARRMGGRGD